MCGAGDHCKLAPLVRAGVWEHFRTWHGLQLPNGHEPEINHYNQFQDFLANNLPEGWDATSFLAQFSVARASPSATRPVLLQKSRLLVQQLQENDGISMIERAVKLVRFAEQQLSHAIAHNIALSLHSKVHCFFLPTDWCIYDNQARIALGIGNHHAAFLLFYIRLHDLGFTELVNDIRVPINNVHQLWPERIIDKMLWIMGSNAPFNHFINNPNDLVAITGQPLADQINDLTNQICPIICASPLGQFLLTKRSFNVPE
jgi:hypothetical protein